MKTLPSLAALCLLLTAVNAFAVQVETLFDLVKERGADGIRSNSVLLRIRCRGAYMAMATSSAVSGAT